VSEVTVSPGWARNLVEFAASYGVASDTILAAARLTEAQLHGEMRLPIDQIVRLWRAAVQRSEDCHFGFHFGQHNTPWSYSVVGYTLMNARDLNQGFERLVRYQRLISEGGAFQKTDTAQGCKLSYLPHPGRLSFSYHQLDAVMTSLISFSRWAGGQDVQPLSIRLTHNERGGAALYQQTYGVIPEYGARENAVVFSRQVLQRPIQGADSELGCVHQLLAEKRLQVLNQTSVAPQVMDYVRRHLGAVSISRTLVAGALGLSEKTLQRRLHSEHTSFAALHDGIRDEIAKQLLADPDIDIGLLPARLGYSDSSAFYKAFRRQNQETPGAYRARLLLAAAASPESEGAS